MKKIFLGIAFMTAFILQDATAQKYFTREGKVNFVSDAALEKIEAKNSNATSVLDAETGRLEFAVLVKAFHFEKALMQEHFNENYMESSKYPKAVFKGKIENFDAVDLSKDGTYEVTVSGDLNIHGVTNSISTKGNLKVDGSNILASSVFKVLVADYGIKIPKVVADNIAKEVEISVDVNYQPLNR